MPSLDLDTLILTIGRHNSLADGACVMEVVSYVAGEPWSDHPQCCCPVIGAFLRQWNDDTDDACRQRLKPFIRRLVGTRATPAVEERRGWLLTDWMVRVHTPAWLELAGLTTQADALRAMPEIALIDSLKQSTLTLMIAREEARAAARAADGAADGAARSAAWGAAWSAAARAADGAAGGAAWSAADGAAGGAAWSAAWGVAWSAAGNAAASAAARAADGAAWSAAGGAAWSAAAKTLEPTKLSLQDSALQLLERLIVCQ